MQIHIKNHQFIWTINLVVLFGLLGIALGVLYYWDIESNNLQMAQAMVLPKEYLRTRATEEGFDFQLLDRIVWCESHWRMIKNSRSSAYGYFQILDGTERTTPQYKSGLSKKDPLVNIDMGLYLYETRGTSPWNESRRCWGRY